MRQQLAFGIMAPIVCQGYPMAGAQAKNLLDRARLNSYRE